MLTQEKMRKLILFAIYNDEWLYDQLVLKGGNALSMIYKVGMRASLDLDFSIANDFENTNEVGKRIEIALIRTFSVENIHVFDYEFSHKPKKPTDYWWGGYRAEFKLISKELANQLQHDIDKIRRQSILVDPGSQRRIFTIEISKYEYIKDSYFRDYEGTKILVYSPLLLAVEKLRALLQQHPNYTQISADVKRSRSRDLYDIWAICEYFSIYPGAHLNTVEAVFKAKKVKMELLNDLDAVKDLHFSSWSDVELSVSSEIDDYEFYFDYVNKAAKELYSKWKMNSP